MYLKNTEATYIKLDPDEPLAFELANNNNGNGGDTNEAMESITMDNEPLFRTDSQHSSRYQKSNNTSPATQTRTDKMMEQLTEGLVQLTLHQDTSTLKQATITPWRNYGDFIRWSSEPALPTDYSATLEMPARSIQEQLIQVFFTHCQPSMLPTLSKGMLYDQLHTKGHLITPLLLNMIYAHASAYQHQQQQPPPPLGIPPSTLFSSASASSSRSSSPFHSFSSSTSSSNASSSTASASASASASSEGDIFYQRARHLLDDFMDTPRISTVIALIYMVSYENNIQQQQRTGRSSRAWMYSGMAVRMCLELGLHTSHYSSQMSQFDIELRKRVLWTCYVMDKVESCTMERPCMLRAQDITLDLPTPLPEDDQQERNILDGFAPLCRLMMLVEKVLVFFTYGGAVQADDGNNSSGGGSDWSSTKEAQVLCFLDKLAQWRERLPEELQWRPQPSPSIDLFGAGGGIATIRPPSAIVAHLHLLSYDLELSLVLCCRFQMDTMQCERRRAVANTITHLVTLMVQHPHLMYTPSFSLPGFSGIFAALAHAMDVDHPTRGDVAKDAKLQFKLTLEMIRGLVERIPMRDVQQFVGLIDTFLQPTTATAPPFLFVSAMNNLTQLGQTSTPPSSVSNNNHNHNSSSSTNGHKDTLSSSISDHDKIMQRMLGTDDLYEAQMIAKTLSTMQQHHHHHSSFPTPFTTPSPPPIHHHHQQQQQQQQQQQHSYPATASSSSVSSPSSSPPPPPSMTTTSVIPGMTCFDFASSQAAAAAAAAVGAVGPPLTNHQQQQQPSLPLPTNTPTTTPAVSSMMMPAMTIPAGRPHTKSIEPADYTFELISVDDEWAKSLIY
ncbi:unnamed protein product [Absidia cylindrospora]